MGKIFFQFILKSAVSLIDIIEILSLEIIGYKDIGQAVIIQVR